METCKIIAIQHVIIFIGVIVGQLASRFGYNGLVVILSGSFLSISMVLHSIICSFGLSYVWNIILALLPVGFWIYTMIKRVFGPPAFRRAAEIYDRDRESQGNDQNENK
jgi:isoprenylcysteine carboxyl methyltransferase (ICMT) family protein YpbQ